MSRISVVNCCIFAIALILLYGTDRAEGFEPSSNDHPHQEAAPMWFGPRMGRKKRNPGDQISKPYGNGNKDSQTTLGLLDVLKESPLVVVAVNEANRQHTFIPRLGRESVESSWGEEVNLVDGDSISSRPSNAVNPFSPRLGRNNYNPFSPRLGRDNDMPLK